MMPPLGGVTSVYAKGSSLAHLGGRRPVVAGQSPDWGKRPGSARRTLLSSIIECPYVNATRGNILVQLIVEEVAYPRLDLS